MARSEAVLKRALWVIVPVTLFVFAANSLGLTASALDYFFTDTVVSGTTPL